MGTKNHIRIGIGGWTYEPWRGTFYPEKLAQKRELEYANSKLSSIEVNGTYYGSQKPETFAKWHDETPEDFVFSLKGPRFATNRRVLAEAGNSVEGFLTSGILMLNDMLGPINWQFMPTKKFDAEDFEAFLKLLPTSLEGRKLRHAIEVRHESFQCAEFIAMAREYGVAVIVGADAEYPQINDLTAPFVYARIMGTVESEANGYSKKSLDTWAKRALAWQQGEPSGLDEIAPEGKAGKGRDVFLYVISGFKERNPAAAMELIKRVDPAK